MSDYAILFAVIVIALLVVVLYQHIDNVKLQQAVEKSYAKLSTEITSLREEIHEVKAIIDSRKSPRPRQKVFPDETGKWFMEGNGEVNK